MLTVQIATLGVVEEPGDHLGRLIDLLYLDSIRLSIVASSWYEECMTEHQQKFASQSKACSAVLYQ